MAPEKKRRTTPAVFSLMDRDMGSPPILFSKFSDISLWK